MRIPPDELAALATHQEGVVTTRHLRRLGADSNWIRRQVVAGHWQRVHRGVLYLHSGRLPWRAHALAAVLYAGEGAALSHRAAGHALGILRYAPDVIDVSVPADRRVRPSGGVRVRRRRTMPPSRGFLPAIVPEETAIDLVEAARSVDSACSVLAATLRLGTPATAIATAAAGRTRLRRRSLLTDRLADVDAGVESPLERRYHHDVERRHGLPRSDAVDGRWIRADCVYEGFGLRVELDGWLAHPGGRTDDDTWRDNAVLLDCGDRTLRYRWRHVAGTSCATVGQVGSALRSGGWTGRIRRCEPACTARVS